MSRASKWFEGSSLEDIFFASQIDQIGPINWQKIYTGFSSLKEVLSSSEAKLWAFGMTDICARLLKAMRPDFSEALKLYDQYKIRLTKLGDPDYPKLLAEINDPPLWLFYRGDITASENKCLTVVGSRKPSLNAYANIDSLLPNELVRQICIVSGLAYGIDKKAHTVAVNNKRPTIAVMAGGLDDIYPSTHIHLVNDIIENGGALVSEYPPLSRPEAYRFPIRNRIIAGLSRATIIIEAAIKSGTLTTAKAALDYNRDLFAVPGEINKLTAQGANFLIKSGATLLDDPEQLYQYFELKMGKLNKLSASNDPILQLLTTGGKTIDEIMAKTHYPLERAMVELTRLELTGLIFQSELGKYEQKL